VGRRCDHDQKAHRSSPRELIQGQLKDPGQDAKSQKRHSGRSRIGLKLNHIGSDRNEDLNWVNWGELELDEDLDRGDLERCQLQDGHDLVTSQ